MSALAQWAGSVDGHELDRDDYPNAHPWQCHDVWLDYLTTVIGGELSDGHAGGAGYTIEVWHRFPSHRPALARLFTKHHGSSGIRAGDVVFWPTGASNHPDSHVVVALSGVDQFGTISCVSQNPGPARITRLSVHQVAGYLRPIHNPQEEPVTQDEINRIVAGVLDTPIRHEGTDANGKPRTGSTTLRGHIAWANHQTGVTRRTVERTERTANAIKGHTTAINKTVSAISKTVTAISKKLGA